MKSSQKIIFDDIKSVCDASNLDDFRQKRVLITGASGLLGSYFAYLFYYLNEQYSFDIKVDLLSKDEVPKSSLIYDIRAAKNFEIIQKDLSKCADYDKKYDYVIYAAGFAAPSVFLKDPFSTIDVNYLGMKYLLESMLKINPRAKILYFSSSEIYGSPSQENIPTPETYPGNSSVTNNRACYIESKRLTEVLCLNYVNLHKMHIKIIRPALVYGPGITFEDKRVLGQFMKKAYSQKTIDMLDDGSDLRCYCYVSDVLRQMVNVLLSGKDTIYNVGSSQEEISIKDLALIIGDILSAKVVLGPGKPLEVAGAPSRVRLDLSKVEKEFGFKPAVSMRDGLKRTIDWNLALISDN